MTREAVTEWIMSRLAISRAIWAKKVVRHHRRRRRAIVRSPASMGYASMKEAQIAEVQRAFERARHGGGLFGLKKDAEQRT